MLMRPQQRAIVARHALSNPFVTLVRKCIRTRKYTQTPFMQIMQKPSNGKTHARTHVRDKETKLSGLVRGEIAQIAASLLYADRQGSLISMRWWWQHTQGCLYAIKTPFKTLLLLRCGPQRIGQNQFRTLFFKFHDIKDAALFSSRCKFWVMKRIKSEEGFNLIKTQETLISKPHSLSLSLFHLSLSRARANTLNLLLMAWSPNKEHRHLENMKMNLAAWLACL